MKLVHLGAGAEHAQTFFDLADGLRQRHAHLRIGPEAVGFSERLDGTGRALRQRFLDALEDLRVSEGGLRNLRLTVSLRGFFQVFAPVSVRGNTEKQQ